MIVDNLEFHVKRTGSAAAKGTDRLGKSLKNLKGASASANKGLGGLLHTIGRLAKMMLLRQAIRAIMKAFKEGLENVYKFNSMMGGELSAALDQLKSASVQATGAIGSAFGELLATLSPILISILNLISRVANAIAQLFAVLGGRSTYTKAVASSEKWADATQKGAKAAKEWKNQLMGFDEINRLEEPSDSSSGSDSPYDGAFELAPAVNEWASELRRITLDWWHSLDLEPITKAWDRLRTSVSEFVDLVDGALYWAYTNVLLPLAGWTIEKGLPATLEMVASLLELITTILKKLAPYFEDFYNNVLKPAATFIGNTLVNALKWLTERFESLREKVEKAKNLKEFIESLSGGEEILVGLAVAVTTVVTAFMAWKTVTSIIGTVQSALALLGSPTGIAILAITALVSAGIWLYNNWDTVKEKATQLKEWVSKKWQELKDAISKKIDAINEKIKPFGDWIYDHITKPVEDMVDKVKKWFDDFKQKIEDTFGDTIIGKLLGFKSTTDETATSVSEDLAEMGRKFGDVYNDSSVLGSIASAFENLGHRSHSALDDIGIGLQRIIGFCRDALSGLTAVEAKGSTVHVSPHTGTTHGGSGGTFAAGGFPDEGELFMAREGGIPEMVGRIGNRTAVANNDQIVAAISDGVFSAVVSAMGSSGGSGSTPVKIYLDGREIASTTTKYQRQFARAGTM